MHNVIAENFDIFELRRSDVICEMLLFVSCRIHTRIAVKSCWKNLEDAGVTCFFLSLEKLGKIARKVDFSLERKSCVFMCGANENPS